MLLIYFKEGKVKSMKKYIEPILCGVGAVALGLGWVYIIYLWLVVGYGVF